MQPSLTFWRIALGCSLAACSASEVTGAGGAGGRSSSAGAGSGGSYTGGSDSRGGSAGAPTTAAGRSPEAGAPSGGAAPVAAGAAGRAAAGAAGATAGAANITLTAVAANGTVGLEWDRVVGASAYKVYWATTAGVDRATAEVIDTAEPAAVHRRLTNGTAYHYVVTAVVGGAETSASNEVAVTPNGEWVLEQLGSGDFSDVITGARVTRIPIARRIHVLLLPEGYLSSELAGFHDHATHDSATPTNDVDRWLREVFAIEPYSSFREAFVVWYLPRASPAHVGEGTTAFGVQLAGGGVGSVTGAAAPLWSALDDQGGDAFAFPPATPVLNHVAAFLLLDASRSPPRAGFSGLTTSLANPSRNNQRIRAGFAQGHAHEFTHAFANVSDEYLENDNTVTTTSETSNVVAGNQCSTLPWAHLLAGAGINTTEQLVGAFGRPQRGYRSELLCLMNGTHDNGEHYCGDASISLTLRPNDRLCNWCRELTSYRIFEKTGILSGAGAFETWKTSYRTPFYQRFPFRVPMTVPQTFRCGQSQEALYEACTP